MYCVFYKTVQLLIFSQITNCSINTIFKLVTGLDESNKLNLYCIIRFALSTMRAGV